MGAKIIGVPHGAVSGRGSGFCSTAVGLLLVDLRRRQRARLHVDRVFASARARSESITRKGRSEGSPLLLAMMEELKTMKITVWLLHERGKSRPRTRARNLLEGKHCRTGRNEVIEKMPWKRKQDG